MYVCMVPLYTYTAHCWLLLVAAAGGRVQQAASSSSALSAVVESVGVLVSALPSKCAGRAACEKVTAVNRSSAIETWWTRPSKFSVRNVICQLLCILPSPPSFIFLRFFITSFSSGDHLLHLMTSRISSRNETVAAASVR